MQAITDNADTPSDADVLRERSHRWARNFQSETEYADADLYFGRRFKIFQSWGPRPKTGDDVLQIGCGDGYFAHLLATRRYRVMACDVHPEMLEKTAERNREFVEQGVVQTKSIDINSLPFDINNSFAHVFVVMRSFFHYAHDPEATLREIRRLTGTRLIIDLDPRQFRLCHARSLLRQTGFRNIRVRAFLTPQKRVLPLIAQKLLDMSEPLPLVYRQLTFKKFNLWLLGEV